MSNSRMLTVQKLIDYLKTQDPNANILGFEINSNAWIHQFPDLPNAYIHTIEEEKKRHREYLEHWYKGCEDKDQKVQKDMDEVFRYAESDKDIVICL